MKRLFAKLIQFYYFFCYQYAHTWYHLWGTYRLHINHERFPYCYLWGRHDSPEPIRCKRCGWAGAIKWLKHDYEYDGFDDVEPVDECPKCGGYL
uniref:Uncharacterized protein n=1 Tax=viral metagenome TaxID=1070528 RepID=A0A6M3LT36_9ZZZZ